MDLIGKYMSLCSYQGAGYTVLLFLAFESTSSADIYDGMMDTLAQSGASVFVLVLYPDSVVSFFNATKRNSRMGSSDVIYISIDSWTISG